MNGQQANNKRIISEHLSDLGRCFRGAIESLSFWENGDSDQMEDYETTNWHESGGFWG